MATNGTLINVSVASATPAGTGTVTVVGVRLRDCSNGALPVTIGTSASVAIDNLPPTVAVTTPNGGDLWIRGTSHAITWNATDNVAIAGAGVDLAFTPDSGATWTAIASGLDNVGSYLWTVPPITRTMSTLVRATVRDINGNVRQDASDAPFTLALDALGVADGSARGTMLRPPVPDPFHQQSIIAYSLARPGRVDLAVFAVDGRRVRTLDQGARDAGEFRIAWDGRGAGGERVSPGVYFVRLNAGTERFTRRVTLLE